MSIIVKQLVAYAKKVKELPDSVRRQMIERRKRIAAIDAANHEKNLSVFTRQVRRANARRQEFKKISEKLDEPRAARRRIALARARAEW